MEGAAAGLDCRLPCQGRKANRAGTARRIKGCYPDHYAGLVAMSLITCCAVLGEPRTIRNVADFD